MLCKVTVWQISNGEVILEQSETACHLPGYSVRPHNKFHFIPATLAFFSCGHNLQYWYVPLGHLSSDLAAPNLPSFLAIVASSVSLPEHRNLFYLFFPTQEKCQWQILRSVNTMTVYCKLLYLCYTVLPYSQLSGPGFWFLHPLLAHRFLWVPRGIYSYFMIWKGIIFSKEIYLQRKIIFLGFTYLLESKSRSFKTNNS